MGGAASFAVASVAIFANFGTKKPEKRLDLRGKADRKIGEVPGLPACLLIPVFNPPLTEWIDT